MQGLFGQEGMAFAGPGLVHYSTVQSFMKIASVCESIKDKEKITIYGDLVKNRSGGDYLFMGKKVVYLYSVTCDENYMEVNRKPWDN